MAALIIAYDLVGVSSIEHRQLRHFLLDRAHPSKEGVGVRSGCAPHSFEQRDLGLVLARRQAACPAGERAVGCDTDTGFDRGHDCLTFLYHDRPAVVSDPFIPELATRNRIITQRGVITILELFLQMSQRLFRLL